MYVRMVYSPVVYTRRRAEIKITIRILNFMIN